MTISRQRIFTIFYALVSIVSAGTIGYMVIEDYSFLEALYMTVITASTVGFREVRALSDAGRVFTVVLIIVGVGAMLYTLTTIVQYLLEGHLANIWGRRRMREKISGLKDHVVLCGYGLVGREVAEVFRAEGVPFVIVELSAGVVSQAEKDGMPIVQGNATSDDVLEEAGIGRARAMVAALGSDADNIYVTLSARALRSDLFIVARAATAESEPKLRRAGANRTMSPYRVGGRRLAMLTLRPVVVDFVDTTLTSRDGELVLENVRLSPGSPVCGQTIEQSRRFAGKATVLAVRKADGLLIANPQGDTVLEVEDELMVIGTRDQLRLLEGSV